NAPIGITGIVRINEAGTHQVLSVHGPDSTKPIVIFQDEISATVAVEVTNFSSDDLSDSDLELRWSLRPLSVGNCQRNRCRSDLVNSRRDKHRSISTAPAEEDVPNGNQRWIG